MVTPEKVINPSADILYSPRMRPRIAAGALNCTIAWAIALKDR